MMRTILAGQPGCQNYLDDIVVYGKDTAEHDVNLKSVLHRLNEAGLKMNTQKCTFNQPSLPFLGLVISKDGLRPSPDSITALNDLPVPQDMAALRSFLGQAGWFIKFIPNYATLVEPQGGAENRNGH